jgi:imidazole glycerol-phosphate synthase subunit HisF
LKYIRIIPRLDIKGPNLVKGINLEGLRVLGNPEKFAKFYYEQGADELIYQDTVASLYQRNSLIDIITKTAKDIFIPITVGGGIRSLDDIKTVLRAGADKVSINTAAIQSPKFISEASSIFGSSTIVVAIEAIKQPDNSYLAYTDNGREYTGVDVLSWAKNIEELGAGEILLTAIDQEGTGSGFDFSLIKMLSDVVKIPIICHGGASKTSHIVDAIKTSNTDAVAISSMIHYSVLKNNDQIFSKNNMEGNTEFLDNQSSFNMFGDQDILKIKNELIKNNISVRN